MSLVLSGNHRLLLVNGTYRSVQDLKAYDEVFALCGGRFFRQTLHASKVESELYEIGDDAGRLITCNPDTFFMRPDGSHYSPGQRIHTQRPIDPENIAVINKSPAEGLISADPGWIDAYLSTVKFNPRKWLRLPHHIGKFDNKTVRAIIKGLQSKTRISERRGHLNKLNWESINLLISLCTRVPGTVARSSGLYERRLTNNSKIKRWPRPDAFVISKVYDNAFTTKTKLTVRRPVQNEQAYEVYTYLPNIVDKHFICQTIPH